MSNLEAFVIALAVFVVNLGIVAVWFAFTPDEPAQPAQPAPESDESYGRRIASPGYRGGGAR